MGKNVKNDNVKVESQKNEHAAAVDAEKDKKFKEQKAAAAKKFKEKRAAELKSLSEIAKKLLPKAAEFKFTPEETALLQKLANPAAHASSSGQSFFNRVFGDSPKVGDSIKLLAFFEKTMKSKADLDKYVKQWAEKGIIVEFKQAANQLESTYTIKALPSA